LTSVILQVDGSVKVKDLPGTGRHEVTIDGTINGLGDGDNEPFIDALGGQSILEIFTTDEKLQDVPWSDHIDYLMTAKRKDFVKALAHHFDDDIDDLTKFIADICDEACAE